ncbi:MAG TPA: AAA family ATPase [Bacteroidales bacterium]|nr:AAA family ATPase [Bacteroidales bacterium]
MFKRDISSDLKKWSLKPNRKPLVLRGARQVGKTTVVNLFGKEFDNYISVNMEDKTISSLFENFHNVSDLLVDLFIYKGLQRKEGRTLLFIDEIQNSPKAVASLRYFYEEIPHIFVIAAGSLLESLIDVHLSFPVGRVEYMAIHPFSFREYLEAIGDALLKDRISNSPITSIPFHDKLIHSFNRYALIGGMPEVVKTFIENQDILSLTDVYESLIQGYKDDVEKYASNKTQTNVIRHILSSGWGMAGNTITFNRFAGSEYKSREMGEAFRTLEKAMLLELVYPITQTTIPLLPDKNRYPKLIWLDSGLVNYAANIQKEVFGSKDILDAWRGCLAEQIVAQELLTLSNKVSSKRSYWVRSKTNSTAEVDFIFQYNQKLVPIEVKTGHNAHLRSLHLFIDQNNSPTIAIRIWSEPFSVDEIKTPNGKHFKLINIPFYLVGFIPNILNQEISASY